LLEVLARLDPHPESVPINALVAVPGTPLAGRPPVEPLEVVRMCAAARILMPSSFIRLSAGRAGMSKEAQILCFLAGANSIFVGEKLLTTANVQVGEDVEMLRELGVETLRELGADEP
jgi:biotin synthase